MLERKYQSALKKKIEKLLPEVVILKNDPEHFQGIPDLTLFHKNKYALLEVKAYKDASIRPNQKYYIDKFNEMAFASFISPENEEEVLDELYKYFTT